MSTTAIIFYSIDSWMIFGGFYFLLKAVVLHWKGVGTEATIYFTRGGPNNSLRNGPFITFTAGTQTITKKFRTPEDDEDMADVSTRTIRYLPRWPRLYSVHSTRRQYASALILLATGVFSLYIISVALAQPVSEVG